MVFPTKGTMYCAPVCDREMYAEQTQRAGFWHRPDGLFGMDVSAMQAVAERSHFASAISDIVSAPMLPCGVGCAGRYTVDFTTATPVRCLFSALVATTAATEVAAAYRRLSTTFVSRSALHRRSGVPSSLTRPNPRPSSASTCHQPLLDEWTSPVAFWCAGGSWPRGVVRRGVSWVDRPTNPLHSPRRPLTYPPCQLARLAERLVPVCSVRGRIGTKRFCHCVSRCWWRPAPASARR